jgi:hypothetical protein
VSNLPADSWLASYSPGHQDRMHSRDFKERRPFRRVDDTENTKVAASNDTHHPDAAK